MGIYYDKGNYKAVVTAQAMSAAKTGNPQFLLTIQPTHFVPAGKEPLLLGEGGTQRTIFKTITDKTIDYLLDDLQRLGFTGGSFTRLDPAAPDHQSFVGQEVDAYCIHENDQDGQLREKWNLSSGGGGIKAAPLDVNGLAKLDALFGRKLSERFSGPAPTPRKAPPVATPAGAVVQGDGSDVDDGIPF